MEDARFAAQHAADPALGREPGELVEGRLRRAVVRDRDLTRAEDHGQEGQIGAHAAGQVLHWELVGAHVDIGRDALGLERARLGHQRAHVTGEAVGAEAADDGRHTAADDLLDSDFRCAGGGAAFATAPEGVEVGVNHPRQDEKAGRVDLVDFDAGERERTGLCQGFDAVTGHQDVAETQRLLGR